MLALSRLLMILLMVKLT